MSVDVRSSSWSVGVICCGRWVLSENVKKLFQENGPFSVTKLPFSFYNILNWGSRYAFCSSYGWLCVPFHVKNPMKFQVILKYVLCFWMVLKTYESLIHCLFSFFFVFQLLLYTVFDTVSSSIDKVFSLNPSANGFVSGNFTICCKDFLTHSNWTNRTG